MRLNLYTQVDDLEGPPKVGNPEPEEARAGAVLQRPEGLYLDTRAAGPESEMGDSRCRLNINEMLSSKRRCNGTNHITGTGSLEYLVLQSLVRAAIASEIAYNEPKESLNELLLELQKGDASTASWKQRITEGRRRNAGSTKDNQNE